MRFKALLQRPAQPKNATWAFLVLPAGVSDKLLGQVRERGVTPVEADVSEFLKKGGGSVKCMIGDLGPVRGEDLAEPFGA